MLSLCLLTFVMTGSSQEERFVKTIRALCTVLIVLLACAACTTSTDSTEPTATTTESKSIETTITTPATAATGADSAAVDAWKLRLDVIDPLLKGSDDRVSTKQGSIAVDREDGKIIVIYAGSYINGEHVSVLAYFQNDTVLTVQQFAGGQYTSTSMFDGCGAPDYDCSDSHAEQIQRFGDFRIFDTCVKNLLGDAYPI